eukprot:5049820-Pleurochrysis_carterae.AAC.1
MEHDSSFVCIARTPDAFDAPVGAPVEKPTHLARPPTQECTLLGTRSLDLGGRRECASWLAR